MKDFLCKTPLMRVYMAALILNFADCKFVFVVRLFKYLMIRLLQSKALMVITTGFFVVLGWFKSSTRILVVVFGSKGSSRDNSSALVFSSLGICVNRTLAKLSHNSLTSLLYFLSRGSFTLYSLVIY